MSDCSLRTDRATEILRPVWPEVVVIDVRARAGGQLSSVYEVQCAVPAESVIVKVYDDRWDWFASIGETAPLPGITADIRQLS
ncbi:hypothetical protein GCM10023319_33320 [Nocardia iowensis]